MTARLDTRFIILEKVGVATDHQRAQVRLAAQNLLLSVHAFRLWDPDTDRILIHLNIGTRNDGRVNRCRSLVTEFLHFAYPRAIKLLC